MTATHRILIVEDSDDDAQLLLRELRREDIEPSFRRVETLTGIREALQEQVWDIVISDFNLPEQSFPEIMSTVRELDPDVPVIVVSGSIGEENVVALMRGGVADFVYKGNLKRLAPAIQRELKAAAARVASRESDQRFRDIVEVSGDWIWETDADHRYTFFSARFNEADWADSASLGKTAWELAGANLDEDGHWRAHLTELEAHRTFRNFLFSIVARSGSRHHVSISGVPVFDREGAFRGYRGTATDETPIVSAFWRAEEAEALLRDATESISEGFVIFDPEDRIVMANEAFRKLYSEVADHVQPGVSFEEFVQAAIERGVYPDAKGKESEWLDTRLEEHQASAGSVVHKLANGRWVMVTERRMSNGGIAGLRMDISALKKAEAQRDHLAGHDAVTGLPNTSVFTEHLSRAIASIADSNETVAIASLGLTSLADIHDSHGLDAGEAAIREIARRLCDVVSPGETVSHIGAGQFLVLRMGGEKDPASADSINDLLAPFAEGFTLSGAELPFRIALGVSVAAHDGHDAETMIRNATTAMQRAKQHPSPSCQFYNSAMTDAAVIRSTLESDLRHAIDNDEFTLAYQPQVNTHNYKLVGAEALLRWNHPKRGPMPPCDFIPIAEETGLIRPIGEHVLRLACRQAKLWRERGGRIPLAVNISAVQLAEPDFHKTVVSIVSDADLPAEAVVLELTESAILRDVEAATHTMQKLAGDGIRFSLDDFGIEHSALSHLSDLPFDTVKIDRAFVTRMIRSRGHAALNQAIVAMIHSLGMTAVAEGIEEPSQLIYLQAYGCDVLQGYLFSRPVPAEEFAPMLAAGIVPPAVGG